MKRDDIIHPVISGNKWRKLKYNLVAAEKKGKLITVGGAFSNHLVATAAAAAVAGIPAIGIVRGDEVNSNPSLDLCKKYGMEIIFYSRTQFDKIKRDQEYFSTKYPGHFFIPEGGMNSLGVQGTMEILKEEKATFDYIIASAGTGTTAAGLCLSADARSEVIIISPFKGSDFLTEDIQELSKPFGRIPCKWKVNTEYQFGGFGKVNEALVKFANDFLRKTNILLDPIYTSKMVFGVFDLIEKNYFRPDSRILMLHTGGTQGISGMNQRLKNKPYAFETP